MDQTGFECFRCKHWAARSPDNAKLDGNECACARPLHQAVIRNRQKEAVMNAVIFGGVAFLVLSLLHVSSPALWRIVVAVILVTYGFYLWFFGRRLRQERPHQ